MESTLGRLTTSSKAELCQSPPYTGSGHPLGQGQRAEALGLIPTHFSVALLSSARSSPGPFSCLYTKEGLDQKVFNVSKAIFCEISVNFILVTAVLEILVERKYVKQGFHQRIFCIEE